MVEWKKLGEISTVQRGKRLTKNLLSDNEVYPVYHGGIEPLGYFKDFNRLENTVMVINVGASAGSVGFSNQKFWSSDGCFCISHNKFINNKYLYFFLLGKEHYLRSQVRYAGIPTLDSTAIEKILIPIPPLSEQNRIVGILDTFTESIENLKKQITERKKQYDHYRDQLLDLEGKPEKDVKQFGEICEMIKGNCVQKTDFVDEGIGCIHYGQIYTHYGSFTYTTNKFVSKEVFDKAKKASKGDIVMTDTSENVEDICKSVAYLGEEDIAVSNHALIIKHRQNPKFLSYTTYTKSFFNQKRKYAYGVKVTGIKPDHLARFLIYLPSIEEQNHIVSILDTFEASIANLEQQLSLRQKQYEYYRNMLLTFDE